MKKSVIVIGAGPSGLVALKELLEAGHDAQCFEKAGDVGGVFSNTADNRAYDSAYLTISNYYMSYSDFLPYEEPVRFWTRDEYNAYLNRYADHFELRKKIHLSTEVKKVRKAAAGGWDVDVEGPDGPRTVHADNVAVCSGQFQIAYQPMFEGLDSFDGPKIHSVIYKQPSDFDVIRGKRVLAIGMGESAADIVVEAAKVASSSILNVRRHHVITPKFVPPEAEHPIDVAQTRFWHTMPAREKAEAVRDKWRMLKNAKNPAERHRGDHCLQAGDEPGSVVTKTEHVFEAVAQHRMTIKVGEIKRFTKDSVVFGDGKEEKIEAVVFCTGFRFALPFFDTLPFKDVRDCYKQMIHPEIGPSLAFIGFVRPSQGGVPLMAELQARYYALILAGKRTLPNDLAGIARRDADKWRAEFYETPHVNGLVNGLRFNEEIAELIGCRPPGNSITNPRRFLRYWFEHIWPSQYRLVGPGARPELEAQLVGQPSIYNGSAKKLGRHLAQFGYYRLRDPFVRNVRAKIRPLIS